MDGTIWLIVNSASGSNDEAALAALQDAFAAAGRTPDRVIDCSTQDLPTTADLTGGGVTVLAIFTGDGTINAAVPKLEGWDGAVLVLPGGTANLLARALHGERSAAEIVALFGEGQMARVRRPCLRFDQGTALIEVLAGPGATWSDVREGLRDGDLGEVATKTVEAVKQSANGSMVAVVAPPLGNPDGYAGVRLVPTENGIAIDGYGAETLGDYVKQGIALLKRDFREGPHDELGFQQQILCRAVDDGAIELMLDGERATGRSEEQFKIGELAVDLLAPRDG